MRRFRGPRAIALELASAHPDTSLPCPDCAASVKASNLERHLAKTHPGEAAGAAHWAGADHAIQVPVLLAGLACVAGLFASLALAPEHYRVACLVFILVFSVVLGVGVLSVFGRLPAALTLDGDTLVLRYALGRGRRRVRLPPRSVEVGSLLEHRTSAGSSATFENAPGYDVQVGSYLRVTGEGGTLALGSKTGTSFRKHWSPDGWSAGAARRRRDITLPPPALVAVEYLLAELGALKTRSG